MTKKKLNARAKFLFKLLCRKNTDPHTLQLSVMLITCFAAMWVETENEPGLDPTRHISYKALARGCVWVLDVMAAGRHKYYEEPLWHLIDFLVVPVVMIHGGGYKLLVNEYPGPDRTHCYPVCFWFRDRGREASESDYIIFAVQINRVLDSIWPSSLAQPMDKEYPIMTRGHDSNIIVNTLPVLQYASQCIRIQQQESTTRRFLTDKLGCEYIVDMIIEMCFSEYQEVLSLTTRSALYYYGPYYKALMVPMHEAFEAIHERACSRVAS